MSFSKRSAIFLAGDTAVSDVLYPTGIGSTYFHHFLHEVVTAYLHEEFKFSRSKAARYVTAGCIFLGVFCSLSLGIGKSYTVFGLNLFDLFDFVTAKLMLPLGGFFISIFIGWYLDKKIVWEEVSNNGTTSSRLQTIDIHPEIHCPDRNCIDFYQ